MSENIYYTYAWLRKDGTPYYIGKGKNGRAFDRRRNFCPPRERVLILKKSLSEEEAFRHEVYMIAVLGRKDLGTGILRNLTDGGEGASGRVVSEETRKKFSGPNNPMYGKKASEEAKKRMSESRIGRRHSEETKQKMSGVNNGMFGKTGENHPSYGKPRSEITKRKISEAVSGENHPMCGKTGEKNPFYGKTHTEETKQRISKANTGKIRSPEIKQKLSEAQKLAWQRRREAKESQQ